MNSAFRHFLFIISCTLLLVACAGEDNTEEQYFNTIIKTEQGHFRGVEIGDSLATVKAVDPDYLVFESEEELEYQIPLVEEDSSFFDINYSFDEFGLFEIQVDIYLSNPDETTLMFERFKTYFNKKYGESMMSAGYTTWLTQSAQKNNVEVSLIDESTDFGYNLLSITFFEQFSD